ncbi:epimerase EvaD [Amycolatopsis marina]|uniref:Epimerase EvaD n=1 Tax=Amycolatopsis marina TaxID=490629 RepID=A0A1I0ZL66_9PSEU|nr:dTDP-4-dehydrorhamnose 3,5-epimerase family protein [Amycolatopsis marina]SFB26092.1 epimerase EvaD [Amycolatopsis marina]
MRVRELSVEGALELTPKASLDDRGLFVSPFQETHFRRATGRRLFNVAQTNHSQSRRGVIRGIHYTVTPPGCAKYVYCPHGAALDVVVDIRVGSPTFGRWDVVEVDPRTFRSVYFPIGVGHVFVALQDDTVMSYMISGEYVPENELALFPLDLDLGLPLPKDVRPIISERDRMAPTLAEAEQQGLLPRYDKCKEVEETLWLYEANGPSTPNRT